MTKLGLTPPYLSGHFLIAMPAMSDPRFAQTVIYMCAHDENGAMGLVVNKPLESVTFTDLLKTLEIEVPEGIAPQPLPVHAGGPVETSRGFVLHSKDYVCEGSMVIDDRLALTATLEVLRAVSADEGPDQALFALGYAGWAAGQLDQELQDNGWLTVPGDPALIFDEDNETKWMRALGKLGINPTSLSGDAGHA